MVLYYIDKNKIINSKENILIDNYNKNVDKWINLDGIVIKFEKEMSIEKLLINDIEC